MDKLKADGVNNGRVRDDDFLAELAIPFREESGRPFSRELRSSDPGPYLHKTCLLYTSDAADE